MGTQQLPTFQLDECGRQEILKPVRVYEAESPKMNRTTSEKYRKKNNVPILAQVQNMNFLTCVQAMYSISKIWNSIPYIPLVRVGRNQRI